MSGDKRRPGDVADFAQIDGDVREASPSAFDRAHPTLRRYQPYSGGRMPRLKYAHSLVNRSVLG